MMTDLYLQSGWEEVIAFPKRKSPEYNDWYEEPLRDADLLGTPEYEERLFTLSFLLKRPTIARLDAAKAALDTDLLELRGYKLRPVRVDRYDHRGGLLHAAPRYGLLTLLARQYPADFTTALRAESQTPNSELRTPNYGDEASLSGTPLHAVGTLVSHAYSTALQPVLARRPAEEVTPSREIVLSCVHYGSLSGLWGLVDRPGALPLLVGGKTHRVYYTEMTDLRIRPRHLTFDLHLQTVL